MFTKIWRGLIILVIAFVVMVACEPIEPGIIDAPTPTQETNYVTPMPDWDISCVVAGAVPITERPCPVNGIMPMEFTAYPSENYADYNPTITCDSGCTVWLHDPGGDGKGRAGRAAIQMHNVNVDEGQLYIAQFDITLNLQDADEGNYSIGGMIHTDTGNQFELSEHGIAKFIDGKFTWNGARNTWSCFRPMQDMTVVIEEWFEALWAGYHPGNNYEIRAIYVYPITNINLCNEVVVIN